MPLQSEIDYWQTTAAQCVDSERLLQDNVYKRPNQLRRLLEYNWIREKVLEIGHGNGMIAGSLKLAVQGKMDYTGTELAPLFREYIEKTFGLKSVLADVRELPGEGYTRLIAFDSLEHVRPEHRAEGYRKMAEVAAPNALLFIHYSHSHSYHDKEFDHPFGLEDLVDLETAGFAMINFERYLCYHPNGDLDYVFVVMQRVV